MIGTIGIIAVTCIVSAGGIGGIMVAAVKFASEIIAKRLEEKYALKMNKSLENYKANIENRKYISKALFDKEFDIYQTLCSSFYEAYSMYEILHGLETSNVKIIPKSEIHLNNPKLPKMYMDVINGDSVSEVAVDELRDKLCEQLLEFRKLLGKSSAFIPHDNQKLFIDLLNELSLCVNGKEEGSNKLLVLRGKMQVELRSYLENLSVI